VVDAGETALLFTIIEQLTQCCGDLDVVVGLTCDDAEFRQTLSEKAKKNLRIFKTDKPKSHSLRVVSLVLRYIPEYIGAELVLDVSGDGFTDGAQYGMFASFSHASQLLSGIFLKKPVMVCAQSIGPFNSFITRVLGFFILNRVDLITVREDITEKYLAAIGVSKPPLYLTADLAFLLTAQPIKKTQTRVLIGFSISQIIYTWAFPYLRNQQMQNEAYIQALSEIVDYAMEKYTADAVFILHTTGKGARHDDHKAALKVLEKIKHKDRVKIIANSYQPAAIKQAISQCDIFVASKMHTAVAAITMLVPTVSIAYNYKVYGIVGHMLKQQDLIVDIRTLPKEQFVLQMKAKIDFAWENKQKIREELQVQTAKAHQAALHNIELINSFLRA
jgi:polysaccharide pyruvyl transferase WcaK-like protein